MSQFPSVFYKAKRIGQYGREFTLYKFRTMVENADKFGGSSTSDDDQRITRIGRVLRKSKLDELPQLINIIRGEIKLVGWRPEAVEYLNTIPEEILRTKPGLIGLATLWDIDEGAMLKGEPDPDEAYRTKILPKKRELELYYVRNKSFKLDLWIFIQTLKSLLRLNGKNGLKNTQIMLKKLIDGE